MPPDASRGAYNPFAIEKLLSQNSLTPKKLMKESIQKSRTVEMIWYFGKGSNVINSLIILMLSNKIMGVREFHFGVKANWP